MNSSRKNKTKKELPNGIVVEANSWWSATLDLVDQLKKTPISKKELALITKAVNSLNDFTTTICEIESETDSPTPSVTVLALWEELLTETIMPYLSDWGALLPCTRISWQQVEDGHVYLSVEPDMDEFQFLLEETDGLVLERDAYNDNGNLKKGISVGTLIVCEDGGGQMMLTQVVKGRKTRVIW